MAGGMAEQEVGRKVEVVGAVVGQVTVTWAEAEMVDPKEVWAAAKLEVQEATRAVTESKCNPRPYLRRCHTHSDSSPCSGP